MAAYYIEALLLPEEEGWRWNNGLPLGTAVSVTYAFMTAAPVYDPPTNDDEGFQPFNEAQEGAAASILALYSEVARISFEFSEEDSAAQILFGTNDQTGLGTSGYAYAPSTEPLEPEGGDIYIANNEAGNQDLAAGEQGYTTLLHEIGHALGLKHPHQTGNDVPPFLPAPEATMQYTVMAYDPHPHGVFLEVTDLGGGNFSGEYRTIGPSTPMLYDIAALQYLYGANTTWEAGNSLYDTFDPNTPFFSTIWDAGGIDVISVANFTLGCEIDLTAGSFSSITILSDEPLNGGDPVPTYDGTDNLAIAFGVVIENAVGGAGDDTITGNAARNRLEGGAGNDVFVIAAASHFVAGERIDGGADDDVIRFAGASGALVLTTNVVGIESVVIGTVAGATTGTGALSVNASAVMGALELIGNDGNNTLTGTAQADTLVGNAGNDRLLGLGGNDTLVGGAGNDTIDGGTGADTLDYSGSAAGIGANLGSGSSVGDGLGGLDRLIALNGLVTVEHVIATAFNDTLSGSASANRFEGGAGADSMAGGAGNDTLLGGDGADTVNGGAGTDVLTAGDGDDFLVVSTPADLPANETIDGGTHDVADTLRYIGGAGMLVLSANVLGIERVEMTSLAAAINVDASAVDNALAITGNNGVNVITGTALADTLLGGGGDDTFRITAASHHNGLNETIDGGAGKNTIVFTSVTDADDLTLRSTVSGIANVVIGATGVGVSEIHVNAISVGSGLNITGNAVSNRIVGTLHDDTIRGGAGLDDLVGEDGNDLFLIGSATEFPLGEAINGGDGEDVLRFIGTTANQTLVLSGVTSVEKVMISNSAGTTSGTTALNVDASALGYDLEMVGNSGANRLTGGAGNDLLEGRGGNDRLDGGGGTDTVSYLSSPSAVNVSLFSGKATGAAIGTDTLLGIESVEGSQLNDALTGGNGNDSLDGAGGNDVLVGGAGNDALEGGDGLDTVSYAAAPGAVVANLGSGTAFDGLGGTDGLAGIENVTGSAWDDNLMGDTGANTLIGGAGNDAIYGHDEAVSSITATRIVAGLNQPVFATAPGGDTDRLFVVGKPGVIGIVDLDSNTVLPTPFLDLTADVNDNGEQGLLGLAFHPNFAVNGFFYVNLINNSGDTEVRRYQVSGDPNVADAGSGTLVITIPQTVGDQTNHKAGWMDFGPDGFLYIATGDGGGGGDPNNTGQDINSLLGKMLRIDVNGDDFAAAPDRNYAIPAGNPFSGAEGADEIWALGLRNPWRNSFDRGTGQLYIADVGQASFEEINLGQAGANYGWDNREGPGLFPGGSPLAPGTTLVDPIHFYGRDIGQSITGGYVYRGPSEGLQGQYFFADFVQSKIFTLRFDGDSWEAIDRTARIDEDVGTINNPSSFGEDALGNLYVVDIGGEIFLLTSDVADTGDNLQGLAGNDALHGGAGNDTLTGGAGVDLHDGGAGDDIILIGSPVDHPLGEVIDGGDGDDTLRFTSATAGHRLTLRHVLNIENIVIGNSAGVSTGTIALHVDGVSLTQDVKLTGNAGGNLLVTGSGNDIIIGGSGADSMQGNAGDDLFLLGSPAQFATGERILGGSGDDTLRYTGSAGTLTLTSAVSVEHITVADMDGSNAGTAAININAAAMPNGVVITGNAGNNNLTGTGFADTIDGSAGNDTINGGAGVDSLVGGAGDDIFLVGTGAHPDGEIISGGDDLSDNDNIRFTAASGTLTLGAGVTGIESVRISNSAGSTAGTQTVHINASAVEDSGLSLVGNSGANRLEGTGQDDSLIGGLGRDTLVGGEGNDVFLIGNGHFASGERIEGGGGDDDRLYFTTTTTSTSLVLNAGVTGLEVVQVSNGTGQTTGTTAANINAAAVLNELTINGNNGANSLTGTGLADAISGNSGNDVLNGGGGADFLDGGVGNDTLAWDAADAAVQGGDGTDTLRIDGKNIIVDLVGNESLAGIEVINLTGSGSNKLVIGAEDVLAITSGGVLRVEGNAGDAIDFVGDWERGANVSIGTVSYRSYSLDGATVLVNPAMPTLAPVGDSIPLTGNALIDGLTQGGSWRFAGERVITYSLDRNFDGAVGAWTSSWQTAVDNAFAAWEALIDVDFVRIGAPNGVAQNASTANISLALAPGEFHIFGIPIFAAIGIFPDPQVANGLLSDLGYSRTIWPRAEGDVIFDSLFDAFSNPTFGPGFEIILHEIGHALGLKHGDDAGLNGRPTFEGLGIGDLLESSYTVMSSDVAGGSAAPVPMLLDILAIQHIYGANLDHNTGDDVYQVRENGFSFTIWDGGGNDTLDASLLFTSSPGVAMTIDLSDGAFSGFGDTTAIAYGVLIENAIGTAGRDEIFGNAADNRLVGNDGHDTLAGAAGNDTLSGGGGRDTLDGGAGNDSLAAGDGADYVTGGDGDDFLDDGAGIDVLIGGAGDDTYVLSDSGAGTFLAVRSSPPATFVHTDLDAFQTAGTFVPTLTDQNGDGFIDTLQVSHAGGLTVIRYSVDQLGLALGPGVYFDAVKDPGEGAGKAGLFVKHNSISAEATVVAGSFIIDSLAIDGTQLLSLSSSFQIFAGPTNSYSLAGTLKINAAESGLDTVGEAPGGGTDTVLASFSYALAANVENLVLTGASDINGIGNELDNVLTGNAGINFLSGAAGADTVDGGVGADTLIGGAGNDVLAWDAADASVQGGTGEDTLRMSGTDEPLDLTVVADGVITDVEIIDLLGHGGNLLTLAVEDVLAISSETDTLRIDGDGADTVAMGGGWALGADQEIGLENYHSYTQGLATLLVDTDITQA